MARVVILGAGIAGHTAALLLKRKLGSRHEVVVISPNKDYQWIPSNIWVGVGRMKVSDVVFELAPVYQKQGIIFHQARAVSIHPEGDPGHAKPFVKFEYTAMKGTGTTGEIGYDFLINATGPKLNFEATKGLDPSHGFSQSVCTYQHASRAWENLQTVFEKMERGEKQTIVAGTGHPTATCQGAAFEYILNIAFEVNRRKLQERADLIWLTNEYELGDFGMGGAYMKRRDYITSTAVFTESILAEYGVNWIKRAGVRRIEKDKIHYETLDGEWKVQHYDFAMLIPSFSGVGLQVYDRKGEEITAKMFASNGFMKVDADYTPKPYHDWVAGDWPSVYQSPVYDNIYAPGIAFAPPHGMAKPMNSKNGTAIFPTAPRTGMPSAVMGKTVALNIAGRILHNDLRHRHKASMARMGAACIVSAGYGLKRGLAATMTVFPIVPDWTKYPRWGRNLGYTLGEAGLAGHWLKMLLHHLFLYKAKAKPFWWLIPE